MTGVDLQTVPLNWEDPSTIYYDLRYTYVKEDPPGTDNDLYE